MSQTTARTSLATTRGTTSAAPRAGSAALGNPTTSTKRANAATTITATASFLTRLNYGSSNATDGGSTYYGHSTTVPTTVYLASTADSTDGNGGKASTIATSVCTIAVALIIGLLLVYLWKRKLLIPRAPKSVLEPRADVPSGASADAGPGSPAGDDPYYLSLINEPVAPRDAGSGAATQNGAPWQQQQHGQGDGGQDAYFTLEIPDQSENKYDHFKRQLDETAEARYANLKVPAQDDEQTTKNSLRGDLSGQL